jgi:hypothetical protein
MAFSIEELDEDFKASRDAGASPSDNYTSANILADQVRIAAKEDLNFLAGLAMPTTFEYMFPPVLLGAWQLLRIYAGKLKEFPKIALGIPRGHGKTTLLKLYVLYLILFTKVRFILIISATKDLAENVLSDIMDMLDETNIKAAFGAWDVGVETSRTDLKKFPFQGRPIILAAIGVNGSLRGLNIKNERPEVMIFEDAQTKECSESLTQSQALERWMYGTAMKAKSPKGCLFIWCGNMYPGVNSILKKIKLQSSWVKFISGAILQDGTALWEDLRSKESLLLEFETDVEAGHPEIFFSEVLNDVETGINTRINFSKFRSWDWEDEELPGGRCLLIDPSTGVVGKDKVAIGIIEYYDETPAIRHVEEEDYSPSQTIQRALLLALQHNIRAVIVEAVAFQATLMHWAQIYMEQYNIRGIMWLPIYPGMKSKNARISIGLKALQAGEIIIHPEARSLIDSQISNWNPLRKNNSDGLLDLVTYAPKILELYPAEILTPEMIELDAASGASVDEEALPF